MAEKGKGRTIKFEWIEKGTGGKRRIVLTAEVEKDKLKLISAKCFPGIICLTCGPAFFGEGPCTQLTAK